MSRTKSKPAPPADEAPALGAKQHDLRVEWLPCDSIHLDPANAREHDEEGIAAIAASLARFGQQKAIVVDGDGIVRDGNGTLMAARKLDWPRIAAHRTPLKGAEAIAYAIAANRTGELSRFNEGRLVSQLRAVAEEGIPLDAMGFDDASLQALEMRLAAEAEQASIQGVPVDDPAGEWNGMPAFDNPAEAHQTIHCHFETAEDVARFGAALGRSVSEKTKTMWFPDRLREKPREMGWSPGEDADAADLDETEEPDESEVSDLRDQ